MTTQTEALKLLVEALSLYETRTDGLVNKALAAGKEALAQPEQEPVAHLHMEKGTPTRAWIVRHAPTKLPDFPVGVVRSTYPLFLRAPPQRKPLTVEKILHLVDTHVGAPSMSYPLDNSDWINFARAIEAAHGIKE